MLAVAPGSFSSGYKIKVQEARMLQNAVDRNMIPAEELSNLANLGEMCAALVSSDALRSFIIIVNGCGLLGLYVAGKMRGSLIVAGITLLCLFDMWSVNKRYLHDEQFVPRSIRTGNVQEDESRRTDFAGQYPGYRGPELCRATPSMRTIRLIGTRASADTMPPNYAVIRR